MSTPQSGTLPGSGTLLVLSIQVRDSQLVSISDKVCLMTSGTDLSFAEKENFVPFLFFFMGREWPGKRRKPFRHQLVSPVWYEKQPSTWSGGRGSRWSACRGHTLQPPLHWTHRSPKGPDNSPKSRWKRNEKLPASIKEVKYKNDHFYLSFENYIENNMPCCGREIQNTHLSRCPIPKKHFVCGLKIPPPHLVEEQSWPPRLESSSQMQASSCWALALGAASGQRPPIHFHFPGLKRLLQTSGPQQNELKHIRPAPPAQRLTTPGFQTPPHQWAAAQDSPASPSALAFLLSTESLSQVALLPKSGRTVRLLLLTILSLQGVSKLAYLRASFVEILLPDIIAGPSRHFLLPLIANCLIWNPS